MEWQAIRPIRAARRRLLLLLFFSFPVDVGERWANRLRQKGTDAQMRRELTRSGVAAPAGSAGSS